MSKLQIVIGTYSGGLIGLEGKVNKLKTSFAFKAANNCIKSLSIVYPVLVAGDYEEMLRIYNLEEKKEFGSLLEGMGAINALHSTNTHLLSANEEGRVVIWRIKDWSQLHSLKGHKRGVNDVKFHPSSRLALSVGKDKKLILWNLLKARVAFKSRFKFNLEQVEWSPCGNFFLVRSSRSIYLFNTDSNIKEEYIEFKHKTQISASDFAGKSNLLVAGDNSGSLFIWNTNNSHISFKAHSHRIIAVKYIQIETAVGLKGLLISLTSQGELSLWNADPLGSSVAQLEPRTFQELENFNDVLVWSIQLKVRCASLTAFFKRKPI